MTAANHYTFGDDQRAAARLGLLARVYEAPSRELLERFRPPALELALDLGAGPGHTTELVHRVGRAARTLGLDASERYLELARSQASAGVEHWREDVTAPSGKVPPARLVFCRFVLTHLANPGAAIAGFGRYVAPGGVLLLQETAELHAETHALRRYYELVGELQRHYGQKLYIGLELGRLARDAPFRVLCSTVRRFTQPASVMAELHVQNLRTWRKDPYAARAFDARELDRLDAALGAIASGEREAPPVALGLGELVLSPTT